MENLSKKLAAIIAKIQDNNIEAWQDNGAYTVPVAILNDFDKNDANVNEPDPENEHKYNGWFEELETLLKEVEQSEQNRNEHLKTVIDFLEPESEQRAALETILTELKNPVQFFLFGGEASKCYHNDGIEETLKWVKEYSDFETAVFDPNTDTVGSLLLEFDGWGDFAEISEQEYLKLREIKDGE